MTDWDQAKADSATQETPVDEHHIRQSHVVIFDGEAAHSHRYVPRFTDSAGLIHVLCADCPHGNWFDPALEELLDGRIVKRSDLP